jgi:hypothetical protein
MEPKESRRERRAQVARELGSLIHRQARRRWSRVRTARRSERGHLVWRFRVDPEAGYRFLHVSHEAVERADNSCRQLFDQLRAGRWLDRLEDDAVTAIRLSAEGVIEPWPAK